MRRNVRADDRAASQKTLSDGQSKAFCQGWSDKRRAMPVAPLQRSLGKTLQKFNVAVETTVSHETLDVSALWPANPNDDQFKASFDFSGTHQTMKGPNQRGYVLISPMLRNAEKKRFASPGGNW